MVPKKYVLHAEPASATIAGHPVGFVLEGDPNNPDGRRLVSRPASGGQSSSTLNAHGNFSLQLDAPLDVGRPGEWHVLKVLIQAMSARGDIVSLLDGPEDARGEDGLVCLNGETIPVQIVSVPTGSSIWKESAQKHSAATSGALTDAVDIIRAAFQKKRNWARGTILVLDVGHLGAVVTPRLIGAYLQTHGNPISEFELRDAWAIGPTIRSSFQFVAPGGARLRHAVQK